MDDFLADVKAETLAALDYLHHRLVNSLVFSVIEVDRERPALLVRLEGSDRLTHIRFTGTTGDGMNYFNDFEKRFEAQQQRCAVGSLPAANPDTALAEFRAGRAAWHSSPFGLPVTRVPEAIIAMDWGMRVKGVLVGNF